MNLINGKLSKDGFSKILKLAFANRKRGKRNREKELLGQDSVPV